MFIIYQYIKFTHWLQLTHINILSVLRSQRDSLKQDRVNLQNSRPKSNFPLNDSGYLGVQFENESLTQI